MEITRAPVVITVGKINAGVRQNIIPEQCEFAGTIRTLDSAMQQEVHRRIRQTAEKIAEASGARATASFETKTLVTFNHPGLVEQSLASLQRAAGAENVLPTNWVTMAEDFSYYGTRAPAFFFQVGVMPKGQDPATAPSHHTADFYMDESGLKTGVKAFCHLALDYLFRGTKP
jgi:amidohydrolase